MNKKILLALFLVLVMTFTACSPSTPAEPDNPQNELEEYSEPPV